MHGLDELEILVPDNSAELGDLGDHIVRRSRSPEAVDIRSRPLRAVRLEHEHAQVGRPGKVLSVQLGHT